MALDLLGRILQIMSKDGNLTFDRTTDSLEAISDSLGDVAGLAYYGVVTAVPAANQFTVDGLSGYGETAFVGWTSFIFWDAGGGGAAPQGESQIVTAYVTATGTFTAPAYTAPVAVGDKVILLHPLVATITEIYPDGAVWFDEFSAITGTAYPYGTPEFPVNSEADARTIAIANNLSKIHITGSFTVPDTMEGYAFIGEGRYSAMDTILFDGQDVDTSSFHKLSIGGAQGGTGMITCYYCGLINPSNISGDFHNCLVQACSIMAGATACDFIDCAGWQGNAVITVGTPNPLNLFGWEGYVQLASMTAGACNVYGKGAVIDVPASSTGGTIGIEEGNRIIDNSGGAVINSYMPEQARAGRTLFVNAATGDDAYNGLSRQTPFATIGAAITAAGSGDRILIAEGGYDEAVSIAAGLAGLEVICEPGVEIVNTTPGTVVAIAAPEVHWQGGEVGQAGQTAFDINGQHFHGDHICTIAGTIAFDLGGGLAHMIECRARAHTTTAFNITSIGNFLNECVADTTTAATRGFYLSDVAADYCVLRNCKTLNCTAGGFETVAGADNNLFDNCSQSETCGGLTDAGANNSWVTHQEESQIAVGNTLQQDLADIHTIVGGQVMSMDFWSTPEDAIDVDAVATDIALPDVVVSGLPGTVVRAVAMLKFRMVRETSGGANALDGAQEIQVRDDSPSAWLDAINFIADQFTLAADAQEGGDVCIGAIDVKATVDGDDTYNFQWDEALADADSIDFSDIQMGLRIWCRVP